MKRSQIVVIGSGPGGAVTACTLAEAGKQVLLLEEGAPLDQESHKAYSLGEMESKYRNGGVTVALGKPNIAYVEGRCLGGGSEVNSGLYHRTPEPILEAWKKSYDVQALDSGTLVPIFESCEQDLKPRLLPVSAPAASLKLQSGATALNWQSQEVPRLFNYDSKPGFRQSMTKTYIPRALKAGCQLLSETKAISIRKKGNAWTILARKTGLGLIEIEAEQLFVCGGAVQTPTLLRRSGIQQNVGNHLQCHPTAKILAEFPEDVNDQEMGVPVHQVKEFSPLLSFGCSISSPPYLALAMSDHIQSKEAVVRNWRKTAIYYCMISPLGHGSVRPLLGFQDALVRYRLENQDLQNLSEGLSKLSQLLSAAGAKTLYPSATNNLMTIHLFSSCPMGENKQICATDSFGKVHGHSNLYVSDASLLCTSPGVNPQGTIMALAKRNALQFLGKL